VAARSTLHAFGILVSAVMAVGCSDSPSSRPIPLQEWPAAIAAASCDALEPCCDADGNPFDQAGCEGLLRGWLPPPGARVAYDAEAASRCVARVRDARATCGMVDAESAPECGEVFQPTVEVGDECTTLEECRPSEPGRFATCVERGPGEPTVCAELDPFVRLGAGERCGLTCSTENGGAFCLILFAPRGACYRDDGLTCSTTTGVCEPLGGLDDPCDVEGLGFGSTCHEDLICEDTGCTEPGSCFGKCATGRPVGSPCEPNHTQCRAHSVCGLLGCSGEEPATDGSSPGCSFACTALPGTGEPCSLDFPSPPCEFPLFCSSTSQLCEPPLPSGSPCSESDVCETPLVCVTDTGTCEPSRDVGERCSHDFECLTGHCSADTPGFASSAATREEGRCLERPRTNPFLCSPAAIATPTPAPTAGVEAQALGRAPFGNHCSGRQSPVDVLQKAARTFFRLPTTPTVQNRYCVAPAWLEPSHAPFAASGEHVFLKPDPVLLPTTVTSTWTWARSDAPTFTAVQE